MTTRKVKIEGNVKGRKRPGREPSEGLMSPDLDYTRVPLTMYQHLQRKYFNSILMDHYVQSKEGRFQLRDYRQMSNSERSVSGYRSRVTHEHRAQLLAEKLCPVSDE